MSFSLYEQYSNTTLVSSLTVDDILSTILPTYYTSTSNTNTAMTFEFDSSKGPDEMSWMEFMILGIVAILGFDILNKLIPFVAD